MSSWRAAESGSGSGSGSGRSGWAPPWRGARAPPDVEGGGDEYSSAGAPAAAIRAAYPPPEADMAALQQSESAEGVAPDPGHRPAGPGANSRASQSLPVCPRPGRMVRRAWRGRGEPALTSGLPANRRGTRRVCRSPLRTTRSTWRRPSRRRAPAAPLQRRAGVRPAEPYWDQLPAAPSLRSHRPPRAYSQARKGMFEGGIPVGAVLVVDGKVVGRCARRMLARRSSRLAVLASASTHPASPAAAQRQQPTSAARLSHPARCAARRPNHPPGPLAPHAAPRPRSRDDVPRERRPAAAG